MSKSLLSRISSAQLKEYIDAKARLERIEAAFDGPISEPAVNGVGRKPKRNLKRRRLTAQARANMVAAAKARWARIKRGKK